MKTRSMTLLVAISFLLINCGNNNAASTQETSTSNPGKENKAEPSSASSTPQDGIVGTWKLSKEVFDDNGNRIPDEAELKKAYFNNYMLQLNADGTCRIQQMFTGHYEKKTENGREMLYVYRKKVEGEEEKDPAPDVFQITSVKKDELVLQIIMAGEPSSFWFLKRIN